jgi:signal transduction histidine kinase
MSPAAGTILDARKALEAARDSFVAARRAGLPAILRRAGRSLGADAMLLLGVAPGARGLRPIAACGLSKSYLASLVRTPSAAATAILDRPAFGGRTLKTAEIRRAIELPGLFPSRAPARTAVAVPARDGDGAHAGLFAFWRGPEKATPAKVHALRLVGEVLGPALAGGRGRSAEERLARRNHIRAFYRLSRLVSEERAPGEAGLQALKTICRTMGLTRASIWLVDVNRKSLWRLCALGKGVPADPPERLLTPGPLTKSLIRSHQGVHHPDVGRHRGERQEPPFWRPLGSLFAAPLRPRGRLIGFLYADRGGTLFDLTAAELELLSALTGLAGKVLQSALGRFEERWRDQVMMLREKANHAMSADERLPLLLSRVARVALNEMACQGVAIFLMEDGGEDLRMVAAAGPGAPEKMTGGRAARGALALLQAGKRSARSGKVVVISGIDTLPPTQAYWPGVHTAVWVPIQIGKRVIGLVHLEDSCRTAAGKMAKEVFTIFGQELGQGIERARLLESLRSREADLGALSAKLETLIEEDRRRIAQELHDEIGQSMTAAKITLGLLDKATVNGRPGTRRAVREIAALIDHTIAETRRISMDLRPAMLDDLGLLPTLRWYATTFNRRTGIRVDVHARGAAPRLRRDHETVFYRFVQEALTNVARHAHARRVIVSIARRRARLRIEVRDDGVGMRRRAPNGPGLGLVGMRERIERAGGEFRVDSVSGRGTRLVGEIPIDPAPRARQGGSK